MMKRRLTLDRASTGPPMGVGGMHVTERIGPKRHRTPEGFLLCEDVCIARTGWMMYGPNECPVRTNDLGFSMINRGEDVLFDPVTIRSFNGKSVTDNHPYGGVTPINSKHVTRGTALNVRRGTGDDSDTLRADLLVTDAETIAEIDAGKREVSAGYEADYETTGDGEGRQLHIIGNHIALVERGRCGPRCAIGDQAPPINLKGKTMPQAAKARHSVSDEARKQLIAALGGTTDPGDDDDDDSGEDASHVHVHMHSGAQTGDGAATMDAAVDARFGAIETLIGGLVKSVDALVKAKTADGGDTMDGVAEEDVDAGEAEEDENGKKAAKKAKGGENATQKTGDSKALETSFATLVADAEILIPGFKTPTFDAKLDRKKTVDSMCAIRRRVLDTVGATTDGAKMLGAVIGSTTYDTVAMDCGEIATVFRSAAGAKRLLNNAAATASAHRTGDSAAGGAAKPAGPMSISDIQALNRKLYPVPA